MPEKNNENTFVFIIFIVLLVCFSVINFRKTVADFTYASWESEFSIYFHLK